MTVIRQFLALAMRFYYRTSCFRPPTFLTGATNIEVSFSYSTFRLGPIKPKKEQVSHWSSLYFFHGTRRCSVNPEFTPFSSLIYFFLFFGGKMNDVFCCYLYKKCKSCLELNHSITAPKLIWKENLIEATFFRKKL